MLLVLGFGRIQFGNLRHRQLRQLIFGLQPIVPVIALFPAVLDVKFVGARGDLRMRWMCYAHADEYAKFPTGMQG